MSGSKAPDFDAYGLLRATHSHNPLSWSITFRLFTSYLNFVFVKRKCPGTRTVFWLEKPNIRLCCCVSSALTGSVPKTLCPTCNRNVETLVQRHSCLRSLTSWAKCLRNAPCQCTAHATARADIRLFKSERVPRTGTFSPNKDEIPIRNKEPDGYQLR